MAAAATLSTGLAQTDTTQATQIVRGTIAFTGTYTTGGDVLNLALYGVQSNYPPLRVFVYEYPVVGSTPVGYEFVYEQGTNPSNGTLVILQSPAATGGLVPITAYGALIAASAAGGIAFEAVFALGN